MALPLDSIAEFDEFLRRHPAAAVYFSSPDCRVCQVLRPKVLALLGERFPLLALGVVDCVAAPEVAGQQTVLAVPSLIVYFDGHEVLRKVRNFTVGGLAEELERPYGLFCGD